MSWIDEYREIYESRQKRKEDIEKKKKELYRSCGTIFNLKDSNGWIVKVGNKYLSMKSDLNYFLCDTELRAIKFASKEDAAICFSKSKKYKDTEYEILFHKMEIKSMNYMGVNN